VNTHNIKSYLLISGVLIILFLLVIFYPINKKSYNQQVIENYFPTPTKIETRKKTLISPSVSLPTTIIISPVDFTGVLEEETPQEVKDQAIEKQTLRKLTPFNSGLFKIDFDYREDKFIVELSEPKEKNKQEFSKWIKDNFPNLKENQFNFK